MSYHDDRSTWFEGQGLWQHIPEADWQDWAWQLKNRLTPGGTIGALHDAHRRRKVGCASANQLARHLPIFSTRSTATIPNARSASR